MSEELGESIKDTLQFLLIVWTELKLYYETYETLKKMLSVKHRLNFN